MRDIKFRAWDDARKLMIEDFQWFKSGDTNADWIIPKHEVMKDTTEDNNTVELSNYPHMRQQFEVMQYTGLKDVNGKEVYEKDVVDAFKRHSVDRMENLEIIWADDTCQYCLRGEHGFLYEIDPDWDYEVIGNIYETPELIGRTAIVST